MKEKYYNTEYLTIKNYLKDLETKSTNYGLTLPPKNKFIPNNFELSVNRKQIPEGILKDNREEFWHCFNNQFGLHLYLLIQLISFELNKQQKHLL